MDTVLIETQYLPSIAFFAAVYRKKSIMLERHENYVKQSYRNRCQLVDASGRRELTVPVIHRAGKVPISEVRIDYSQKWVNNHWRCIQSAYGKAPYFEYYADDLHDILYAKPSCLYDLNRQLLSMCLKALRFDIQVTDTMSYNKTVENSVLDLRNAIDVKKPAGLNGIFTSVPYAQVFGSSFVENASIIDLIFCVGPDAARTVKNSQSSEMNK
jgi:hypothetical protein